MFKKLFLTLFISTIFFSLSYSQPPSSFDLRDSNLVTPVKKQTDGTCWCHGTASGLEGNLLVTGNWWKAGESGDPNFAEYHLDWWHGFNQEWNGDFGTSNPDGIGTHKGGDYKIFCSYMSRLEGPIRESDAPGDPSNSPAYYDKPDLFKASYHRYYVPDISWYYIDGDGSQGSLKAIDSIKYAVMKYGVCPTNFLCSGVQTGTWDGLKTYYQPFSMSGDANHSVAIVGWNDDCNSPASEDGAWLCKNSWGPNSSQTPYLWISYYDKHCCRNEEMSVVSFENVQLLPYKTVYYHDYHGWRATFEDAKECFNKFVAVDTSFEEYIVDVSFFTTVDHEDWEVKVYDTFEGGELKDELSSASGNIVNMGYHTRKLNNPVSLTPGNDFYIYLKVTDGGLAYDRTSSPPAIAMVKPKADPVIPSKAEEDQSYYRTSSTSEWTDLYNFEETIEVNSETIDCQGTQNFCIKGFTIDTMPVGIGSTPTFHKTHFQLHNYPNPFSSQTTIQYNVAQNSRVSIDIFNARGIKVYSFADAKNTAGIAKMVWNGRDKFNNPLPSGVYYTVLKVKTGNSVMTEKRRMFLMK